MAAERRSSAPTVAVVGAGMAGLACARSLSDAGLPVTVFDKSHGTGGRMATRRYDNHTVDHGAQYFRARDPRFVSQVETWARAGVVETWRPRLVNIGRNGKVFVADTQPRYIGMPTMNAPAKALASGLEIARQSRVVDTEIQAGGCRVVVEGDTTHGPFDFVVIAVPAPQAAPLLAGAPGLAERAARVAMKPCWAVMLRFNRPLDVDFDAVRFDGGAVAWACRDSSKGGRAAGDCWVLHANADWSAGHLEQAPGAIKRVLLDAFFSQIERSTRWPVAMECHRWRYARADSAVTDGYLFDSTTGLGACGDWTHGASNVESAYLSGLALATRILRGD